MSFRPTRASSPVHPSAASVLSSLSQSTNPPISVPELSSLTQFDVNLIEAIIQRASPTATTFLTVFKAYNDVLQDKKMDPHEVVYYGKLLKLGTLKGASWGDKWEVVKETYAYTPDTHKEPTKSLQPPLSPPSPLAPPKHIIPAYRQQVKDDDLFTLHSHQDGTESSYTPSEHQYHHVPIKARPQSQPALLFDPPFESLSLNADSFITPPRKPRVLQPARPNWDDSQVSDDTEHPASGAPSTTPPSYRAATRGQSIPTPMAKIVPPFPRQRSKTFSQRTEKESTLSASTRTRARQVVAQARERKGSVINDNEAWKNIRMAKDEEEADRFREDRLVERFWDVWKQGFDWIRVRSFILLV